MENEKSLAVLCHALGFIGILGPLIIWLIGKDNSQLVDRHGKESLNFQISYTIYFIVASILCVVLIGFLALLVLVPAYYVFMVIAAVKASKEEFYEYPLIFRLIK